MATTLGGGAEKVNAGPGTRAGVAVAENAENLKGSALGASVAVAENLKGSALGASVALAENLKGSALAGGAATRGCAKLYIRGEGPRPCWSGPCAGALVNEKSGTAPRSRIEPAQLGASVAPSAWARGLLKLKMRGDGAARCTTGEAVSLARDRGLLKLKMRGDRVACGTDREAVSLGVVAGAVAVLVVAGLAEGLARLGGGVGVRTRSRTADESDCRSHASITAQIWVQ